MFLVTPEQQNSRRQSPLGIGIEQMKRPAVHGDQLAIGGKESVGEQIGQSLRGQLRDAIVGSARTRRGLTRMPIDVDSHHIEKHIQRVQLVNGMGAHNHRHGRHTILERATTHGGFNPGLVAATAGTRSSRRLLLGQSHLVLVNLFAEGAVSLHDVRWVPSNGGLGTGERRRRGCSQRIVSSRRVATALKPRRRFLC